jgi:hypothetical protein
MPLINNNNTHAQATLSIPTLTIPSLSGATKCLGKKVYTQLEGHGRGVQRSTVLDIFLNGLKKNTLVEATQRFYDRKGRT